MTQSDIINNNFNKVLKCIKSSNAYITGEILNEEKCCKQLIEMKRSTFDVTKFTVVGSPVISDDGIASGFDNSNYIRCIQLKNLANKSWTIKSKWINQGKTSEKSNTSVFFDTGSYRGWGSISYDANIKRLYFYVRTGTKEDTNNEQCFALKILKNVPDWIEAGISFNIETGEYTAKADWGEGEVLIGTYTPNTENKQLYSINNAPESYIRIGTGTDNTYNKNAADLKQFSITVNGEEVFTGNKTGLNIIKADDYTVVGSPTITVDGIVSGFSSANYVLTNYLALKSTDNIKIKVEFTTSSVLNTTQTIINYGEFITVFIDNDKLKVYEYNEYINSQYTLDINKKYYFIYTTTNSGKNRKLELFDENNVQLEQIELSSTSTFSSSSDLATIGIGKNKEFPFLGTINLNTLKIYTNDNLTYQPCLRVPYTESKTGSKIVDVAYRNRVQDVYEQFGAAPYYTLDETNNNFTLPMGEIYGMKADTNLNNLSDIGKKVIDGQWINSSMQLSSAIAKGNYTIDLSEYLPNDNYNYEILITCEAYKGDVSGSFAAYVSSDLIEHSVCVARNSTYSRGSACSVVLPVNQTRKIYYNIANTVSDMNVVFYAVGYRRIGTNS